MSFQKFKFKINIKLKPANQLNGTSRKSSRRRTSWRRSSWWIRRTSRIRWTPRRRTSRRTSCRLWPSWWLCSTINGSSLRRICSTACRPLAYCSLGLCLATHVRRQTNLRRITWPRRTTTSCNAIVPQWMSCSSTYQSVLET